MNWGGILLIAVGLGAVIVGVKGSQATVWSSFTGGSSTSTTGAATTGTTGGTTTPATGGSTGAGTLE